MNEIEAAEAASRAEAEETVGRWLGGPYSIPTYIVMCESGGNYGAVNASSGAGGAYQILPSTWALYGGRARPQDALEGRTGPDRGRNLGRLRRQRLGLRLIDAAERSEAAVSLRAACAGSAPPQLRQRDGDDRGVRRARRRRRLRRRRGLGKNVVKSRNIAPNAVKTADIAKNAVKRGKIAGATIDDSRLANGSVGTNKLVGGSVTTGKLASASVTEGILSSAVQGRLNAVQAGGTSASTPRTGSKARRRPTTWYSAARSPSTPNASPVAASRPGCTSPAAPPAP